jgi:hypothetical protein
VALRVSEAGVVDLRETIGEKTSNNLLGAIHHVPVVDDRGLFIALVPNGTHDQERRLAYSLEDTEQSSDCYERGETEA